MCYALGSVDHATGVCPMCKVFKPPGASRCPHIKEVCHNRAAHPRHDVVYLKNPEVKTFLGCGFCKWARTNPPSKSAGYQNPGWPGCCRRPGPEDQRLIGAADWYAVSIVHHIPIPPEIKAILESAATVSPTRTTSSGSPAGSVRVSSLAPSMSRRTSYSVTSPSRAVPVTISKGRMSGSPQQLPTVLAASNARSTAGDETASSLPTSSAMEQYEVQRRSMADIQNDRRLDTSSSAQHSPSRKSVDLSASMSRRSSTDRRPSISAATTSMSITKLTVDAQSQRRRTAPVEPSHPSPPSSRVSERQSGSISRRSNPGGTTALEVAVAAINLSSASSDSSGSNSETTVISDGGFTDYLSDESEAELQRQAEAKAALLAQNHMEEQEFKAARQQLAHVDLRPPKSWTGNINNTMPRSQAPPTSYHNSGGSSYADMRLGSSQSASTTQSRG